MFARGIASTGKCFICVGEQEAGGGDVTVAGLEGRAGQAILTVSGLHGSLLGQGGVKAGGSWLKVQLGMVNQRLCVQPLRLNP